MTPALDESHGGTPVARSVPRSEITSLGVVVVQCRFVPSDLDDARCVVAAASPEVNREVAARQFRQHQHAAGVPTAGRRPLLLGGLNRLCGASGIERSEAAP